MELRRNPQAAGLLKVWLTRILDDEETAAVLRNLGVDPSDAGRVVMATPMESDA